MGALCCHGVGVVYGCCAVAVWVWWWCRLAAVRSESDWLSGCGCDVVWLEGVGVVVAIRALCCRGVAVGCSGWGGGVVRMGVVASMCWCGRFGMGQGCRGGFVLP